LAAPLPFHSTFSCDGKTAVSFDLNRQSHKEQTSAVVAAHCERDLDNLLRREELCKIIERRVIDGISTREA